MLLAELSFLTHDSHAMADLIMPSHAVAVAECIKQVTVKRQSVMV
ncbi:hypothetical protein BLA39750_07702 [Burkholderia lata]|uniref:Uncharacterized protein n=1 Tax=Burkholderia lata (strain ATCC 17760 / DSM 23089 / LMG 22485 / NCIMB 9086 / R18194 / 383) TaxID=482957 RepID=A0A6P3C519_BURL3|nr:hypothetical protein BLA39750_07702 [Burkholderia lata]